MFKLKSIFFPILLILALNLAHANSLPPERGYQVEIIAFKHLRAPSMNRPEAFSEYPALPNIQGSHDITDITRNPTLYSVVPPSLMKLNREADSIADNRDYTLLFHDAWYQEEGHARLLRLTNTNDLEEPSTQFDGTVKVTKGLYYYVTLDLLMAPHYTIKETRRVRKDEIHYIDHPAFGLLVMVHPLKSNKG